MPPESSSRGPEVEGSAGALLQFIEQAAEILTESLHAGPLEAAIVQGSGFCGAMAWEGAGAERRQRLLLSPEEITASMTLRLLEEAPDE